MQGLRRPWMLLAILVGVVGIAINFALVIPAEMAQSDLRPDGRSLIGALLAVGEGRRETGWCAELLAESHRSSDFAAAPARGLTLIAVDYPPDDELADRVTVTRDVRTLD